MGGGYMHFMHNNFSVNQKLFRFFFNQMVNCNCRRETRGQDADKFWLK